MHPSSRYYEGKDGEGEVGHNVPGVSQDRNEELGGWGIREPIFFFFKYWYLEIARALSACYSPHLTGFRAVTTLAQRIAQEITSITQLMSTARQNLLLLETTLHARGGLLSMAAGASRSIILGHIELKTLSLQGTTVRPSNSYVPPPAFHT